MLGQNEPGPTEQVTPRIGSSTSITGSTELYAEESLSRNARWDDAKGFLPLDAVGLEVVMVDREDS